MFFLVNNKIFKSLLLTLSLSFIVYIASSQKDTSFFHAYTGKFFFDEQLEEIINSITDSALNYLYFTNDSLAEFFPIMPMFEAWDTNNLFRNKYDFSNKRDTTILILTYTGTEGYFHPINGKINSDYGWRRRRYHYGIDIALNIGDSVKVAFDGIVRIAQYHKGYGNIIIVRHFNGLETTYAHLNKILVLPNQTVHAGDIIGLGGSTGRSTGPHLHFELRYMGAPFDPKDAIDFENQKLKSDTLILTAANFNYSRNKYSKYSDKRLHNNSKYKTKPTASKKYYTIKKGDTLSEIAMKNKTTVNRLCQLNNIKPSTKLKIGMKLRIH